MGLGLYIAKAIADAHGSRIWVESAPGQGSTFFVTLPLGGDNEATDGDRTLASAERCR
jgi:signal transduction histidine kinase